MSLLEVIKERRSIRKYKDVAVEWDKMVQVLEAGRWAPSAGNLQEWKFVVVTEKSVKKKVADACLKQDWIETAPILIVICSNPEKPEQFYGKRGKEMYTFQNCAACAENMILTATEQGLGTCWVGAFDDEMLSDAVGMPGRAKPMMVLTFGYADEKVPAPPRTVLESIVFLQSYGNKVKNVNMVLWDWSLEMEKHAKQGKEAVQSGAKKLHSRLKEHAGKLKESAKKKMEERKNREKDQ
ncbi:MAG: nitroreductase family protein [Candidatus Woesearchaeota archaeon]